jgi:hypothetical protein
MDVDKEGYEVGWSLAANASHQLIDLSSDYRFT